jgi:endonuclease/exonuclease/phosphatase family metal-dependent hydrolase
MGPSRMKVSGWHCLALAFAVAQPATAAPEFVVATYNVLYLNRDLPALARTIRETKAELVALQETNPESERFLRRELGGVYRHMTFRGGNRSDGFGFLSQSTLRNFAFVDPLPGWRGAWIAEAALGGTNVQFVSVHLATPRIKGPPSLAGVMKAFQEAEDIHAREIRSLHAQISTNLPVVVLGDFNSFSFFTAPVFLREHGYVDSFAAVTPEADQKGTWLTKNGEVDLQFRIDFIFHTQDLRTRESRILRSQASDHFPVVSRLAVGGR